MPFLALLRFCDTTGPTGRAGSASEIAREAPASWACDCAGGGFGCDGTCDEAIARGVCRLRKLRESDLVRAMQEAALSVQPWCEGGFGMVRRLQEARNNFGHVDQMKLGERSVAVKRMPNHWISDSMQEFEERNPDAAERPWLDLGLVRELNRLKFPYACELLGIFRDSESTYIVTSLAAQGDLHSWCAAEPRPGREREEMLRPIMRQTCKAVKMLHDLGIAHRDLSMENILLAEDAQGKAQVKIIDFAMSTLSRVCRDEARGKVVYRAPEMHEADAYDAFLADAFALGVVAFAAAFRDYPWSCTRLACASFRYVSEHGMAALLSRRQVRNGSGETLSEVCSAPLAELLDGLLAIEPLRRLSLGERAPRHPRGHWGRSVWALPWFGGDAAPPFAAVSEESEAMDLSPFSAASEGGEAFGPCGWSGL
mmetsp:Transcript_18108/g.51614  ORF Transcript_18108/g.51614 Transcript_18108/m.51614 type:complete len:426 (-) Transcript_18108:417-1694(-)